MPGEEGPPSYEVLAAVVASLRRELAEAVAALAQTRAELAEARERIAELEARLRQNPRNSSRPPSSEGLAKPAPKPRSLRKKSGRKPGGQDGHKGTTLAQVARPDREIRHEPGCCGRCGAGLAGRPVTGVERRQVFDLPPVRAEVTEHQLIERECGCGQRTRGAAPPGAEAPVQYGPRIAAVIVYLYAGQFLSKERTAVALSELFGIPLSSGTVAALTARAAGRLDGFLEQVRQGIIASDVAGFDETGFRVAGRLAWVHCARTGKYTLLTVHPKRGQEAMEAMGVLPRFAGVAVHDAWAPYDTYTPLTTSFAVRTPCASCRPSPMPRRRASGAGPRRPPKRSPRCSSCKRGDPPGAGRHGPGRAGRPGPPFRSAALIGASQTAARSGALMKKQNALARRLLDRQDDYLRFTADLRVPSDNDLASHCTSWVRSAVSGFSRWSGRVAGVVFSMACGTDIFRQRAAEAGVVAAS